MRLITTVAGMRDFMRSTRAQGSSLGLVPTMGALHEGHLSLVRRAKSQCDAVVVSIFVNPTQFAPGEDLSGYPRDLDRDIECLGSYNVAAVFAPSAAEMYPAGSTAFVDAGGPAELFEGAARPGHFRGVATVVLKLLNLVRPDVAYFGQKDFQQVAVVLRLARDLNLDTRIVVCPVVREPNGLARSSRNAYLTPEEREQASVLHRSLQRSEQLVHDGETDARRILDEMQRVLASEPALQVEYVALVEPREFRPVERVNAGCVGLVAGRIGAARLIDNCILGPAGFSSDELLELALHAARFVHPPGRFPGLETESVRRRIENCRKCAALSSIVLPPREFLSKYVKQHYPDLNAVRIAVIGRDAPFNPESFLYRNPDRSDRFVTGLYELVGVKNFSEFKSRCVLTDAIRCHSSQSPVPAKALEFCAKHLVDELSLFPNLDTLVVLGEDAYQQFQKHVVGRNPKEVTPFLSLVEAESFAQEELHVPSLGDRKLRVFYCFHPAEGYKQSRPLGAILAEHF